MKLLPKQWKNLSFWGVFFFIVCAQPSYSQDTLRIFYSNGEHKLFASSKSELSDFVFTHDLKFVDSIALVGYADSTGQKNKNQKLSERRVKTVKNYLYKIGINDSVPIFTNAMGEESDNESTKLENHRRVEVVLFFTKAYVPPAEEEERPSNGFVNTNCYVDALEVMSKANISYFMKGNTRYVKLEMEVHQLDASKRYFSLTARNRYPKLVKWESETTGAWWWKHPRYIASLKAKDFEKYGIVTLQAIDTNNRQDCTICGTDPISAYGLRTKLMSNQVVMQNMLVKKRILPRRIEMKIPKEYISLGRTYYLDSLTNYPINWIAKSGRKAAPFYFAEIPMQLFNTKDFQVYSYRYYCENAIPDYEVNAVDTLRRGPCLFERFSGFDFSIGAEFSYRHLMRDEGSVSAYFQVPFGNLFLQANMGYTSKNRVLGSIQADYHFFAYSTFPEYRLSSNPVVVNEEHRILSSYVGTSFTGLFHENENSFLNEFHLGISFWNRTNGIGFDRAFIQAGVGFDYLNKNQSEIFSVRAGLQFRFY